MNVKPKPLNFSADYMSDDNSIKATSWFGDFIITPKLYNGRLKYQLTTPRNVVVYQHIDTQQEAIGKANEVLGDYLVEILRVHVERIS